MQKEWIPNLSSAGIVYILFDLVKDLMHCIHFVPSICHWIHSSENTHEHSQKAQDSNYLKVRIAQWEGIESMRVSCFYKKLWHIAYLSTCVSISTITNIFPWCVNWYECVVTIYLYGHAASVKSHIVSTQIHCVLVLHFYIR